MKTTAVVESLLLNKCTVPENTNLLHDQNYFTIFYNQNCCTAFIHTYAYLELFTLLFSLNKQIIQLFQFIRAILRLLNHTKRLKFQT